MAQGGATVADADRVLRKDAQRNRDLLLAVAARSSPSSGVDVSLEDIARAAGVGIGTLYRHFPTRAGPDRGGLPSRGRAAVRLGRRACWRRASRSTHWPPGCRSFVGYVATKRGLSAALKDMMSAEPDLFTETRTRIYDAAGAVLSAAADAREIRPDVDATDLMRAMSGICMVTDEVGYQDRAAKLMSLLLDGLRYGAASPA